MKNTVLFIAAFFLLAGFSFAQWSSNGSKIYYNNGNVGIGTSNPSTKLHVRGNYGLTHGQFAVQGNSGQHTLAVLRAPSSSQVSQLGFNNASNNKAWYISARWNVDGGGNKPNDRLQWYYYTGSSWLAPMVLESNGDVGIGIENATDRLHIKKNSDDAYIKITNNHYASVGPEYGWRIGLTGEVFHIRDHNNNGIFQIDKGLNITMGIEGKKTVVLGKLCVKPTATTACPDYVFEDDYQLKSLSELKSYIEEHKHLPGVKSAGEIQEEGSVDFIEMSYSLLEKVEELTLYTIEQEERMAEMAERIRQLEEK